MNNDYTWTSEPEPRLPQTLALLNSNAKNKTPPFTHHVRLISFTDMPGLDRQQHYPIQPLLASHLVSAAAAKTKRRTQMATACVAVDDALRGGLMGTANGQAETGLVCITGDKGSGRTALAFALLSSHLLSSPTAHATLIDTAGAFDVGCLYATILSRLRRRRAKAERLRHQSAVSDTLAPQQETDAGVMGNEGEEEVAAKVLDRVNYTRVFDFEGLVDAVAEVREGLEARTRREDEGEELGGRGKKELDVQVHRKEVESRRGLKRTRNEVTHIDDTDDEMEEDDDANVMPVEATREGVKAPTGEAQEMASETQGEGLIVVDCISYVVGPMMKTNLVQTSALLSSFLRSLKQLTTSHALSTILINGTVTWNAPRQTASPATHATQAQSRAPTYTSSIFSSSSHLVPALSPILAGHIDLHLLLTKQPWSHVDAVALNSTTAPHQVVRTGKKAKQVNVLEVLSDRYGDRVGRWGPFTVNAEGLIVDLDGHGREAER